jgi:hypothetical protein
MIFFWVKIHMWHEILYFNMHLYLIFLTQSKFKSINLLLFIDTYNFWFNLLNTHTNLLFCNEKLSWWKKFQMKSILRFNNNTKEFSKTCTFFFYIKTFWSSHKVVHACKFVYTKKIYGFSKCFTIYINSKTPDLFFSFKILNFLFFQLYHSIA